MTTHAVFPSIAKTVGTDFRVLTKIFGGLLGTEYIIAAGDRYYRCGELSISQLKRGIPASELDLLEVDPDAEERD